MARTRRSRRTWITFLVLILVSITVITLDERAGSHHVTSGLRSVAEDVFNPVRSGVDAIIRPIGDFFAGAFNYGSLQQENEQLRATNGRLRMQSSVNAAAATRLRQITALEHLSYIQNLPYTVAQVINGSPSNYQASIEISKGTADGVDKGMPVVGNGGLVGQVTQVSTHTAFVTLVTDGSSKVAATLTGLPATVVGQGPGNPLAADYVATTTGVTTGEELLTSGLQGGEYPADIPVGTVTSHKISAGSDQQTIRVKPAADLNDLGYVDVVQWLSPP